VETHFASPKRTSSLELKSEIELISTSSLVSGLLNSANGVLAILDDNRQIVAVNNSFLEMLGLDNPQLAVGLRPGEVLNCVHAHDEVSGCGTSSFCSSCGAAVAIVASQKDNAPVERICALTAKKGDTETDMALKVRSHPIMVDNKKFLLLYLMDITTQQRRAALERTFFHDINNLLFTLVGESEMLYETIPSPHAKNILRAALRLKDEFKVQRALAQEGTFNYYPTKHQTKPEVLLAEQQSYLVRHPAAHNKTIEFPAHYPDVQINTDISLVSRILNNMIINALEATGENGIVKIWVEVVDTSLLFHVWNDGEIQEQYVNRIFQRSFSTKSQDGRGIGTFSMRLFGEKILGGKVYFTTSAEKGTQFTFALPM
jgi:K+-sensing histidine kinase KdpD